MAAKGAGPEAAEAGPAAGAGRKRRWGASTACGARRPCISISTDSLKGLIPARAPPQEAVVELHPPGDISEEDEGGGGGALGALPALPRLLETRLVLEKSRPMELRLRYHLDKLLRAAAAGAPGATDPLRFRPQPGNMGDEEEEEEEDEEGPSATKAPGLGGGRRYVPPRLVPVQYAEAGPEREQRALAAARRRALGSALVRELREELGDAPEEVGGANGLRPSREEEQRTRLEESLLVRLAETRRQRAQRRRRALGAPPLGSITHFGAAPALLGAPEQVAPKRRRAVAKRGRGRRRGGRRRR
uniref:Uncharacterized protein n=1 Tax=Cairina moschata TaxID=8855 RepID=A0A8C3BI98_CAIMO